MVRSIVGTLLEVGRGEKDSDTIQTAIVTGDRNLAGKTASPQGLTLERSITTRLLFTDLRIQKKC